MKKTEKILALFRLVRSDPEYARLTREYEALEERFTALAERLSEEDRDIVWAYICTSEEMNWRMLSFLCERFGIEV